MTALIVDRLKTLERGAASYGAKFVWLVPPTEKQDDLGPVAVAQATAAGVTALIPYQPGEMPTANYADGFHLNAEGAKMFTPKVASSLKALIQTNSAPGDAAGSQRD
jgi:lysophospholipase L1-like esterase